MPLQRGDVRTQHHELVGELLVFAEGIGIAEEVEHLGPFLAKGVQLSTDPPQFSLGFSALFKKVLAPLVSYRAVECDELGEIPLDLAFEKDAGFAE